MTQPLTNIRAIEAGTNPTIRYAGRLLQQMGAEVVRLNGMPASRDDDAITAPFGTYLDDGKLVGEIGELDQFARNADLVIVNADDIGIRSWLVDTVGPEEAGPVIVVVTSHGLVEADCHPPISDLVIQYRSGLAYNRSRPVADPQAQAPKTGVTLEVSLAAGVAVASAAVAGLLDRKRFGRGQVIDFALMDYCVYLGIEALAEWERGVRKFDRKRTGRTGVEVAGGSIWALPCSDGWIIASPREDHQWERWVPLLGSPEWADDQALCGGRQARKANWKQVQKLMGEITRKKTKAELFAAAREARVPCFPISTIDDLFSSEQLKFRGFFEDLNVQGRTIKVPGLPFQFRTLVPALNEIGATEVAF